MWTSVNAKIKGISHIKSGTPCQDYNISCDNGDTYAIILSDGAGSALHSEIGANIVCESVKAYVFEDFEYLYNCDAKEFKSRLIHRIRTRLGIAAKKHNSSKNDFASTLLFVAVNNNKFICGHLGDGIIGTIDNDNNAIALSLPENGEFANSTYFTTSKNYLYHLRIAKGCVDNIQTFFIMSDGSAECLFHKNSKQMAKAVVLFNDWLKQYKKEEVAKAIGDNMKEIFTRYTNDDCSLSMLQKQF